jgi:hypothetical protein
MTMLIMNFMIKKNYNPADHHVIREIGFSYPRRAVDRMSEEKTLFRFLIGK